MTVFNMAAGDKMLMNLNYGLEVDNFYLTTININCSKIMLTT